MTAATWWAHEARRCGRQAFALPALAALATYAAVATGPPGGTLLGRALLTSALPVGAALAVAATVAREPMAELHLTLPTSYPRTVARRLAVLASFTAVAAGGLVGLLAASGHVVSPAVTLPELAGLTALLGGCAAWATAAIGSAAAASTLVVAACLAKLLLVDRMVPEGFAQALPALVLGAWLTALALRALADGGRLGARPGPEEAR
ncbi:hypothetical protein AB0C51_11130 [Streptomyces pathocidini]|uniref:hypothetical protein n=1 Tax=Streptomyces pathocidini TaxID=1650571 RepID=UPI0033EBEDF7